MPGAVSTCFQVAARLPAATCMHQPACLPGLSPALTAHLQEGLGRGHGGKGDKRVALAAKHVHVGDLAPLPAVGAQALVVGVVGHAAQENLGGHKRGALRGRGRGAGRGGGRGAGVVAAVGGGGRAALGGAPAVDLAVTPLPTRWEPRPAAVRPPSPPPASVLGLPALPRRDHPPSTCRPCRPSGPSSWAPRRPPSAAAPAAPRPAVRPWGPWLCEVLTDRRLIPPLHKEEGARASGQPGAAGPRFTCRSSRLQPAIEHLLGPANRCKVLQTSRDLLSQPKCSVPYDTSPPSHPPPGHPAGQRQPPGGRTQQQAGGHWCQRPRRERRRARPRRRQRLRQPSSKQVGATRGVS